MEEKNKEDFSKEYKRNIEKNAEKFKKILKKEGYNLTGYTYMMLEHTFIFETKNESDSAFSKLEKEREKDKLMGWWYGKDEFLLAQHHLKEKWYRDVYVHWFKENKK